MHTHTPMHAHMYTGIISGYIKLLDKPWDAIVSGSKLPVDMRSQMLGCLRSHSLDLNMCKIESVLAMSALPANAISLQSTQMLRAALVSAVDVSIWLIGLECVCSCSSPLSVRS